MHRKFEYKGNAQTLGQKNFWFANSFRGSRTCRRLPNEILLCYDSTKNLNDNARFIDYISRDALKEIMRSWNFYVQGSICEGQPNSILEYFQNGKAFISSNTGFWAELLRKDYYELFFES